MAKRQRCSFTAEGAGGVARCHMPAQGVEEGIVLPEKKHPRSSKLSRTHRLRQRSGSSAGLAGNCELNSEWITHHKDSDSRSTITRGKPSHKMMFLSSFNYRKFTSLSFCPGSSFEDVLWTDKYSPQHSSEVIGNSVSVNTLQRWVLYMSFLNFSLIYLT